MTGKEAANLILGRTMDHDILPVGDDEAHVKLGKDVFAFARTVLSGGRQNAGPSLVDFFF